MLDFNLALEDRERPAAAIIGWSLWGAVVAITIAVALPRRISDAVGFRPAFVGLAAWLTCFHFIYYDSLLAALPVFLLLTHANWQARASTCGHTYWRPSCFYSCTNCPFPGWRSRPA